MTPVAQHWQGCPFANKGVDLHMVPSRARTSARVHPADAIISAALSSTMTYLYRPASTLTLSIDSRNPINWYGSYWWDKTRWPIPLNPFDFRIQHPSNSILKVGIAFFLAWLCPTYDAWASPFWRWAGSCVEKFNQKGSKMFFFDVKCGKANE